MQKWRENLIKRIEELAEVTGLSVATVCHKHGKDGEIYNRLKDGRGMDADKVVALSETLWREVKKARRAKR